jgi:hypothetical protein
MSRRLLAAQLHNFGDSAALSGAQKASRPLGAAIHETEESRWKNGLSEIPA